ncbi:major facilitator superfamily domain-containing protein, partial [Coniella lustricola]
MTGRITGWRWRSHHDVSSSSSSSSSSSIAAVVVPLEQAHLHSYSARCGRTEYEEVVDSEDDGKLDDQGLEDGNHGEGHNEDDEDEAAGMLEMSAAEYSIEGLRQAARRGRARGSHVSEYEMKSVIINKAVQDIGMGRYNWQLFVLCGFGWFADNLWMQGVSLILPSLSAEFHVSEKHVRYTTSYVFFGLCLGAFTWGIGSDMLGRRIAFNATLLITALFGLLTSLAPSWPLVCASLACLGFGVGGNLPVDGALFLEFLPDASSSLLTLLSVWWPVGQLASSLLAWWFIGRGQPAAEGWRQFVFAIGMLTLVMFLVRFFAFRLFESPKFLLSRGRQAEAVRVVQGLAWRNGRKTWLTGEILDAISRCNTSLQPLQQPPPSSSTITTTTTTSILRARLANFSTARLRPLFATHKLGMTTALIWFCWATIGMGYPLFNAFLPQYLSHGNTQSQSQSPADISPSTYREYAILSIVGVPGSVLAYFAVDSPSPWLGRKGTLAISTFVSAVFLILFVQFGASGSAGLQLVFSCVEAASQNVMYGVLYAFTPEIL